MKVLANKLGATIISLEHRYYGKRYKILYVQRINYKRPWCITLPNVSSPYLWIYRNTIQVLNPLKNCQVSESRLFRRLRKGFKMTYPKLLKVFSEAKNNLGCSKTISQNVFHIRKFFKGYQVSIARPFQM